MKPTGEVRTLEKGGQGNVRAEAEETAQASSQARARGAQACGWEASMPVITVEEVMSPVPVVVRPEESLREVYLLREGGKGYVPFRCL